MGVNRLPNGFPSEALVGLSLAVGALGANKLLVDGGCVAPRVGVGLGPNSPPDAAGAVVAGVLSLLENNEGPLVAGVNWNGLLGAAASVVDDDVVGGPPKRLPVWNGFCAGASAAGFAGDAPPKMLGVAAADVVVGGLGWMFPPKIAGVAGVDGPEDFSPKRGFEGDCPVAGFVVLNRFPPKAGGGAGVPFVKIDGFEVMVLFASGDVCIESSPPKDAPNGDGFSGLPWPNRFIGAGLGAGLEALVPKRPPAPVAGVAQAAGAVVAGAPNKPLPGKGCCWAGLCPPVGGRLKMLPLNPEKPLPSGGWLGPLEAIAANGLLLL